MRLDKPIGILLLLWPALWGLWVASHGRPDSKILLIFIVGVVVMRSAGCVMNDYADRDFDPHVNRTKDRPLANNSVSAKEALVLVAVLLGCAFGLVLLLNPFTIKLSLVGFVLAIIYPFMKRFIHVPQLILGIAFAWSILMAFAATTNSLPPQAWVLYGAAMIWPIAYDTMYAMVDREDDIRIGVKSTAILFANYDRFIVSILQTLVLLLLVVLGRMLGLGNYFYLALLGAGVLAGYQQHLIKDRDPQNCFKAFMNNNWFGLLVFLGFILA